MLNHPRTFRENEAFLNGSWERIYVDDRIAMGYETATRARQVKVSLHLSDPDYLGPYEVRVFRGTVGGTAVQEAMATTAAGDGWIELSLELAGAAGDAEFVYAEVVETDTDRMAWSAPIWIELL
jgi:hypothetical protein